MQLSHPDYTELPLADDLKREHRLHKIVAGSAFLFALCLLPVTQYFLVNGMGGSPMAQEETGQVAGVTTERTQQSVQGEDLLSCVQRKDKDTADLQLFSEGKKKAMLRDYESAVQPYREAAALLQGAPEQVAQERAALEDLIDEEYQAYLSELATVEAAVAGAQQEINSRVCPAE